MDLDKPYKLAVRCWLKGANVLVLHRVVSVDLATELLRTGGTEVALLHGSWRGVGRWSGGRGTTGAWDNSDGNNKGRPQPSAVDIHHPLAEREGARGL